MMIQYLKKIILIVIFIILTNCEGRKTGVNAGDVSPSIQTTNSLGQAVKLNDFSGKKVLLHFWADWCADCRIEFPKLEQIYHTYKEQNFEIIAVNVGQSAGEVNAFRDELNLTFPLWLDEKTEISKVYGVRGLPTNFFINPDGEVHKVTIGWVDERQIKDFLQL